MFRFNQLNNSFAHGVEMNALDLQELKIDRIGDFLVQDKKSYISYNNDGKMQ